MKASNTIKDYVLNNQDSFLADYYHEHNTYDDADWMFFDVLTMSLNIQGTEEESNEFYKYWKR